MATTFDGLQADCLAVIARCNKVVLHARSVRAFCQQSNPAAARLAIIEMHAACEKLHEAVGAIEATTDHFADGVGA